MAFVYNNWFILAAVAAVIILSLSGYLAFVLVKLKQQQRKKQIFADKFIHTCCDSMQTIIAATLQQQCNISEAVIRVKAIADTLNQQKPQSLELQVFPHFNRLYEEIKSHPILKERKKLAKNKRMELDLRREALEADLESSILKEFEQIQSQLLTLQGSVSRPHR